MEKLLPLFFLKLKYFPMFKFYTCFIVSTNLPELGNIFYGTKLVIFTFLCIYIKPKEM